MDGLDRVEGNDQPDPCPLQYNGLALQVRASASATQHGSGRRLRISHSHDWVANGQLGYFLRELKSTSEARRQAASDCRACPDGTRAALNRL
ncbi:hypothetical protein [Streptomyces sp. GbtcB7]|uniref:hypothetical protein n=1 Tax=Streptomyces sp. GbtcB7 TaxID=2824752 RepID=UPI001C30178D|nr:hypothetical protein [Streptomyces sp. GbtcB7]